MLWAVAAAAMLMMASALPPFRADPERRDRRVEPGSTLTVTSYELLAGLHGLLVQDTLGRLHAAKRANIAAMQRSATRA